MQWRTACISEAGLRAENQDTTGHLERGGAACWILADGLGGKRGGAEASRSAVVAVLEEFEKSPGADRATLDWLLERARASLFADCTERNLPGMDTTVVILLSGVERALWAHAGDSRLYHIRNGKILRRTKDHSVPQRLVDAGEITPDELRTHEDWPRLLQTLGKEQGFQPGIEECADFSAGDVFLLCSDGFWEQFPDSALEESARDVRDPEAWLGALKNVLVTSGDNFTAMGVLFAADEEGTAESESPVSAAS